MSSQDEGRGVKEKKEVTEDENNLKWCLVYEHRLLCHLLKIAQGLVETYDRRHSSTLCTCAGDVLCAGSELIPDMGNGTFPVDPTLLACLSP